MKSSQALVVVQVILQSAVAAACAYAIYEGVQRIRQGSKADHGDDATTP